MLWSLPKRLELLNTRDRDSKLRESSRKNLILPEISALHRLLRLELSTNNLRGPIPPLLANLTRLYKFLSDCLILMYGLRTITVQPELPPPITDRHSHLVDT
ncbi:leucine-rich repeat receptor-like protein kinase family protein [Striga asiatica]|uniref:Leucine-rich repeat receptor-like protein kinase family protein n=1 Tax=Striga asiatica TaxID=4170 RepID=A0A5A7QEU6_STRAF|nr:leucine-rich repeat receptor-like protein kinase family protein [Striga asiatica]